MTRLKKDLFPGFSNQKRARTWAHTFIPSGLVSGHGYHVANGCPFPNTSVDHLESNFGATNFICVLQTFLTKYMLLSKFSASRHDCFDVYNSVFILLPPQTHVSDIKRLNKVGASPQTPSTNPRKLSKPAIADTALVVEDREQQRLGGLHGLHVAQVHAIFNLPAHYGSEDHLLTYIEWFRPLYTCNPLTNMYRLHHSTVNCQWHTVIIRVCDIQACHLGPRFGLGLG